MLGLKTSVRCPCGSMRAGTRHAGPTRPADELLRGSTLTKRGRPAGRCELASRNGRVTSDSSPLVVTKIGSSEEMTAGSQFADAPNQQVAAQASFMPNSRAVCPSAVS